MNICLKASAKHVDATTLDIELTERLPTWVQAPSKLQCTYTISACRGYYLLHLNVQGSLSIVCQRCLDVVHYGYHQQSTLAICSNDERAEQLMEQFDCIVSADETLNLIDVLTDDLYLFAPEKPHESAVCQLEISDYASII